MKLIFSSVKESEAESLLRPAEIFSGDFSAADMVKGSACFAVTLDTGESVGGYAVRVVDCDAGAVAWIMGAAGRLPGVDLVRETLPAIEWQLQSNGIDALSLTTERRGLIRKLTRAGYQVVSVNLRKELKGRIQ